MPQLHGDRSSFPLDPPGTHLLAEFLSQYLFRWLYISLLIISFRKPVNISKCFPDFCQWLLENQCNKQGVVGSSDLQSGSQKGLGLASGFGEPYGI